MWLKSRSEMDLTSGNLFVKILLFSLPIILTSLFQQLYTSMDLIVVANWGGGYNSMTAVGSNGALVNVIITVFFGIGVGINVVCANAKGAQDKEKCLKVMHSAIWLAIILGVILGVIGFLLSRKILELMHTAEEVIDLAAVYLKWYFAGMPFLMIYNFGSAILRALGDSKRPMFILIICGLLNIALNLFLVIVFNMDVKGVAIATFASQGVSAFLIIFFLMRNKNAYVTFSLKYFKIYKEETIEVFRIGLPSGLQNLFFSIGNIFLQSQANLFGAAVMAGNSASGTLENYTYSFSDGFATGATAFVAQNIGAKKRENVRKSIFYSIIINLVISSTIAALTVVFGRPLLSIFLGQANIDPESIAIALEKGLQRLAIIELTYCLCAFMHIMMAVLKGMKHAYTPAVITLLTCTLFRLFFIYVIYKNLPEQNLFLLYLCMPISWVLADIAYFFMVPYWLVKDGYRKKMFKRGNGESEIAKLPNE